MRQSKVTITDVARRAGVHVSTVSRALNPRLPGRVTADLVEIVQRAAAELGYTPNALASGLRSKRSGTIGIVVADLSDPVLPPLVRAVEDAISAAGYVALVGNTDYDHDRQRKLITQMLARGVDGLVVATFELNDPVAEQCLLSGVPTVAVLRDPVGDRLSRVLSDDELAARLAVEHLAKLGHTHIAHIAGPQHLSTGRARLRGFRTAMSALSLRSTAVERVASRFSIEAGHEECMALLEQRPEVTAIAAGNDLLAIGCIQVLRERGLRCPQDISIVGVNDMPLVGMLDPPLTTVRTPRAQLGHEAGSYLIRLIEKPDLPPMHLVLGPTLVVRASTAEPRN